jgi:hypothetical protein
LLYRTRKNKQWARNARVIEMAKDEYIFDRAKRLYENASSGKILSVEDLRSVVREFTESVLEDSDKLVTQLEKQKNVAAWELEMRQLIKSTHGATGAIGAGGWKNLTLSQWGKIGATVRSEYGYLAEWGREIQVAYDKGDAVDYNALKNYMRMYIRRANGTFENLLHLLETDSAETTEERRLLTIGAKHCHSCNVYFLMGWVPKGTLPFIGEDCECKSQCLCYFQSR